MKQTQNFEHSPRSVPAARRFVSEAIGALPAATAESIELMVSELATNCVRHTDSGFDLTVIQDDNEVRVEVSDRSGGEPRMQSPTPADPTGRGLKIIDMLADTWGVEPRPDSGKTVWFAIASEASSRSGGASSTRRSAAFRPQRTSSRHSRRGCSVSMRAGRPRFSSRAAHAEPG